MKNFIQMIIQTLKNWKKDKAPTQAAALAYYTIFSLGPMVTMIIALLGLFFSQNDISSSFMNQVTGLIGPAGEEFFKILLEAGSKPQTSIIATIISIGTMIFGATGVFVHLKEAINTAWNVEKTESEGLNGLLKVRAVALAAVIVIFFLLLISLIISSIISSITSRFSSDIFVISIIIQIINQVVTIGLIALLLAFIFKYLPDIKIAWKDVWVGAIFTSILFNIGKYFIGVYLGNSNVGSAFGAASSVMVVLVWVYYSAMIVLYGAEFTQVYSERYGSKLITR